MEGWQQDMEVYIAPGGKLRGQPKIPGDKSISHRAFFLTAMAEGESVIEGLLQSEDTLATYRCMQQLGVNFSGTWEKLVVRGLGMDGFQEPGDILNAANSGTTARLLMGLLAAQPFFSVITGDDSLKKRPMGRVAEPLQQMGAIIDGRQGRAYLPVCLRGKRLRPLRYRLPVASAQLKSSLIIASLFAKGTSQLSGEINSRDHTERMLLYLGGKISCVGETIYVKGNQALQGKRIKVPGDISSAAFFLVAGALSPGGEVFMEGVGINPGRTGILEVLAMMGAKIEVFNQRKYGGEPVGDLLVKGSSSLKGVEIDSKMIPRLIDEIPILVVAALFARGKTVIKGAGELRLKESDRLHVLAKELSKIGGAITEQAEGLIIEGYGKIRGAARCHAHGDHRIAMALAIAGIFANKEIVIEGAECITISYPGFFETLEQLRRQ